MLKFKGINSLRRITSKGDFTPEIDGLRFLAILPVVLMHINTNFIRVFGAPDSYLNSEVNRFVHFGELGVRFFFAISGFVLANAFAKFFKSNKSFRSFDLKGYYYRRLTRLEPPFFISTITLFFFTGLVVVGNLKSIIPNLIATLTYTHYLWYGKWSVINPVTWSLEVEVQFYLLAPFLGWLFFSFFKQRITNILLVALIVAVPIIFVRPHSIFVDNPHLTKGLVVYFSHFAVGILMSSIYNSVHWIKVKQAYFFDIVCIAAIVGLFAFYPPNIGFSYIFDLCILLIMVCSFKAKLFNRFFSNIYISTIGGMCYSIYLIHYSVVFGLMKVTKSIRFDNFYVNICFHTALSLLVIIAISTLFYKWFERPFMDKKWPQKLKNFVVVKYRQRFNQSI